MLVGESDGTVELVADSGRLTGHDVGLDAGSQYRGSYPRIRKPEARTGGDSCRARRFTRGNLRSDSHDIVLDDLKARQ